MWLLGPWLDQVTVSPTWTVIADGPKLKSLIETEAPAAARALGVEAAAARVAVAGSTLSRSWVAACLPWSSVTCRRTSVVPGLANTCVARATLVVVLGDP